MAKTLMLDLIWATEIFSMGFRQCSKLSSYAISWKTDEPNLKKSQLNFVTHFGPYGPNLSPQFFLAGFISTSS